MRNAIVEISGNRVYTDNWGLQCMTFPNEQRQRRFLKNIDSAL